MSYDELRSAVRKRSGWLNHGQVEKMDRNALIGMTAGAVFMFGFGMVWLLLGLFRGRPSPAWPRVSLLALGIVLGAGIGTLGWRASRLPASAAQLTPQQLAGNREIGRHFYLIFGAELAAIFLAVTVLKAIHYADYILSGIAIIVGVHFFPLAALFRMPLYYGVGSLACFIGLAGFVVTDVRARQTLVGLSLGALLWGAAGWITWLGLSASSRIVNSLPLM
jgi:hypothetical protein